MSIGRSGSKSGGKSGVRSGAIKSEEGLEAGLEPVWRQVCGMVWGQATFRCDDEDATYHKIPAPERSSPGFG